MKIAMIGHKRIPSREGGVEIVVEELATRMAAMGHDITVYNRGGHNVSGKENDAYFYRKKFVYKGVKVITVPTSDKKSLNAIVYAFLATLRACFSSYDVIHFHAEGPCSMIPVAKLFGKKSVATIHGLDWQRSKWGGFATKFLLFGEKMAAKHADSVIVLSKNVQKYFQETYGRVTVYIPNGIDAPGIVSPNLITKKYGLQGEDYILFLARIVPEKGLHYLIEAYKKLDTEKKLVIAGGSSHSEGYYKEMIELAKEDERIIFTGFVQGALLKELFSNCYLYVLPSDIEGMPISLLEALSYGRRCVVSDIPENLEVAGKLAKVFLHGDANDLYIVLKEEINDNAVWLENRQIQDTVLESFNWEKTVNDTLCVYESLN